MRLLRIGIAGVLLAGVPQMAQARFNDPVQIINSPVDIAQWIAQVETSQVEIIGVRLAETEVGLRVVLEITAGELTVPTTAVSGNAVTAEIPHEIGRAHV